MSLEKALLENTEAVKAHTEALNKFVQFVEASTSSVEEAPKADKPKAEKKAEAKADKPKAEKKAETKAEPAEEEKIESGLTYDDDIKPATLAFVKAKGRDALMEAFSQFGRNVQSAKDLEESQWQDYLDYLEKATNEDDLA